MSQAVAAVTAEVIDLSRRLAPHFPWDPKVGDTYCCGGTPRVVWQLPAPCHPTDFRILGLYDAKRWMRESGIQDIEIMNQGATWKITAGNRGKGAELTSTGGSDVEAALRLVVQVLDASGRTAPP